MPLKGKKRLTPVCLVIQTYFFFCKLFFLIEVSCVVSTLLWRIYFRKSINCMLHKSVDHVVKWVNHVLDFGMFEVILRTILEINLNWNNRTEEVYMPKKCLLDCLEWEQKLKPTEVLTWEGEEVVGKRGEGVIFVARLYLKKCFFNVVWKNFYKRRMRHNQWQFSTWLPRYRHCLTSNCMSLSQENIAR